MYIGLYKTPNKQSNVIVIVIAVKENALYPELQEKSPDSNPDGGA